MKITCLTTICDLFKIVGLQSQSAHLQPLQRRVSAPSKTGIGVDGNMQQLPAKLDSASTEIIIMAGFRSGRAGALGRLRSSDLLHGCCSNLSW